MAAVIPFEHRHAAGVARLCAAEGWPSWSDGSVAAAFSAPGVVSLVAEDRGEVVGAAQLLTDGLVIAYLGLLVVAADARGSGIGRALVQELFNRTGLNRMDLLAEEASTGFYESLPHKTKPGYRLYAARPSPA
jgi:ribosomal protein S18 acetylase RimI-like enzyme